MKRVRVSFLPWAALFVAHCSSPTANQQSDGVQAGGGGAGAPLSGAQPTDSGGASSTSPPNSTLAPNPPLGGTGPLASGGAANGPGPQSDPTGPDPLTPVAPPGGGAPPLGPGEAGGSSPGPTAGGGAAGAANPGGAGTPQQPEAPVEPEPVVRPALVTSGEGAYWQEGELTEAAGGNATLTVDENTTHQDWSGFGGTFNEAGWDALSVLDEAERSRAVRLLFDANEGAHFAWGRLPMGASDYAMDRYSLNDVAGDYAMESFSIARDLELLIPYIKAAVKVNPRLHLWASPWSPPAWMKENGDMNGGRIEGDEQTLTAYALYFAKFVQAYAAEGLTIEAVHPQNEPGYETRYPSCLWTPELLRDFVRDYLGPTFAQLNVDADIWFGTVSAPEDAQHVQTALADMTARGYIKGIGAQWNLSGSVGSWVSQYGVPVMQTEHKCGNYPWESATFNPDRPPNDHAYGEESWGLIKEWLQAGVNSYSAWNMVLDTRGQNLDEERPWPQNALLVVDRSARTLTATPAYYVFRHLSYFVDPGAVRIGTSGNADALAFRNPDGSIITVVHNGGGQATSMTLGVGGTAVQFSVPARGFATINWQ